MRDFTLVIGRAWCLASSSFLTEEKNEFYLILNSLETITYASGNPKSPPEQISSPNLISCTTTPKHSQKDLKIF